MINDFDDLVDLQTLALHCLSPEPSAYVLRTIEIKEKKSKCLLSSSLLLFSLFYFIFIFFNKRFSFAEMMTKFNQGMYAKMRAKKNKPLSNLGKKRLHVVEKGASVAPPALVIEPTRTASPATSVEEITPLQKKQRVDDKGRDKADSHSSSVFDDASLALVRAQEAFTTKELRVFFCMSFNKVGGHIHKLVQVVYLCNFTLFFFFFLYHPKCWIF